ncbi:MAG TPA: hypothetical protein VGX28_11475 [Frankiaceae bacterium]|nr:hypothetical protein [Frankiaceae bacterium]
MSSRFDRVRPRSPEPVELPDAAPVDADGKRALFSAAAPSDESPAAFGAVTVACSSCGAETVMTPRRLLRASLPSLHVPFLKKEHGSFLRCPACRSFAWTSVRLRG